jgi:hypothetical protein
VEKTIQETEIGAKHFPKVIIFSPKLAFICVETAVFVR